MNGIWERNTIYQHRLYDGPSAYPKRAALGSLAHTLHTTHSAVDDAMKLQRSRDDGSVELPAAAAAFRSVVAPPAVLRVVRETSGAGLVRRYSVVVHLACGH